MCPKRSVWFLVVVMVGLGLTIASPHSLYAQKGKDEFSLKVYPVESLQFAENVLQSLLSGRQSTRLQADPVRSIIAIYSDQEGHALVEKTLKEIKGASEYRLNLELPAVAYESIYLEYVEALFAAQMVEQLKEKSPTELGRVAIDPRNNALIVSGSEAYVESIRKLVEKVDVASSELKNTEQMNCTLLVTWIVDPANLGPNQEKLKRVPTRLKPIVEKLVESGAISGSSVLTQVQAMTMVSDAKDSGKFEIQSSAQNMQLLGNATLRAKGTVMPKDDNRFQVSIGLSLGSDQVVGSELMSTFMVKENHPVAFSVSDFGGVPSVLVVEVVKSPIPNE